MFESPAPAGLFEGPDVEWGEGGPRRVATRAPHEKRTIQGLKWVRPTVSPFPGKPRLKGAPAQGLAYERLVGRQFRWALLNPWFEFLDENGPGLCSPDLVFRTEKGLVVAEVKLTITPRAQRELSLLYLPVVGMWAKEAASGVIVCKHLLPGFTGVAAVGEGPVVQWLGHTPLYTGEVPLGAAGPALIPRAPTAVKFAVPRRRKGK